MSDPTTLAGDRGQFLRVLRARLAGGVPVNHTHPIAPIDAVPSPRSLVVDPADLIGSFVRIATDVGATVEQRVADTHTLRAVVERHGVRRAVVSNEPEAVAAGEVLSQLGVEVQPSSPTTAADADLGVTSAVALVAATGSMVMRSDRAGSRTVSLLPRVHLCVVPGARVVFGTAEVFGPLAGHPDDLPSNLLLITGPSRTGDIEQLITVGVHGPTAVHIILTP
jgi:L-lactate dehydrogenase complex protein LldG